MQIKRKDDMRSLWIALAVGLITVSTSLSAGFYGIHSPNGVDVWAVGEAGVVYHSLDGGEEWTTWSLGTETLLSVHTMLNRVWAVGEAGTYYVSTNGGADWSSQVLAGGETLRTVHFLDLSNGLIAGDNGMILRTTDGGTTWNTQTSGTTETLYDLAFADLTTGYASGSAGTLLATVDGGVTWTVAASFAGEKDIYAVAVNGPLLFVGGADGFASKSTDGGTTWSTVNLETDTRTDVMDISAVTPDLVSFLGAGGAIRRSTNGGISFEWGIHPLLASLSACFFYDDQLGWACADRNAALIRTTDGGITWTLPQGSTETRTWSQRLSATSSIGNTLVVNPWNKDRVYVALGRFIYMSGDRGETWSQTATISQTSGSTHSFFISPKDTNTWVVAFTGGGDHVRRSSDRGVTWTSTLTRNFTSYGMPLERHPNKPDTLLFAADGTGGSGENGVVYLSDDFGLTWDTLAQTTFRSPCDIVIVPDTSKVIYIGDGVTGSGSGKMWRSKNDGLSWELIYSVSGSEIPTISTSRLRTTEAYATAWGSGGVMRTQNLGLAWDQIATTGSTWGTDVAKDDPNVVVYGSYGTGDAYISTDGGESFEVTSNNGSNYAYLVYDRSRFFAQQSGGVYKLVTTYTVPTTNAEALVLLSPDGGEEWEVGREEEIRWTSSNIGTVTIEVKVGSGAGWEVVAPDVPAGDGQYVWTVPNTPSEEAWIRVSDGSDGSPMDSSSGPFSITVAAVTVEPESLAFGGVMVGETVVDTLRLTNNGTATLVVTSVTAGSGVFVPGRTSFTIGAGESDTLSVGFSPLSVTEYRDTLVLTTNVPGGDREVILTGTGESPVSVEAEGELVPREYVLEQNYPNPFNPETEIRYGVPGEGHVRLKVYTMLGEEVETLVDEVQGAGWYRVKFGSGELSSGLYLYRLEAGGYVSTRKMLLLK
jgi:photosystem II stability/assembly factor-like uncharacterized protein